jgi:arylsulfatase A-like enzyme
MAERIGRREFLWRSGAGTAGLLLGANACSGNIPTTLSQPGWVILVTIDTLRADHLGCHGYPRPTTPFLDEMARTGVQFKQAYASSSHTVPAHTSLFTGLDMPQHKVIYNRTPQLVDPIHTMAQMFNAQGYDTAAFGSVRFLGALSKGFNKFDLGGESWNVYRPADSTVDTALEWLSTKKPSERVFMWVHIFDPHEPLNPPDEFLNMMAILKEDKRDRLYAYWSEEQKKSEHCPPWNGQRNGFLISNSNYDAEIRFADTELKRFHERVGAIGPKNDTIWAWTGDHGEGMGQHDYIGHGMYLYQEQLHIPLIFNFSSGDFAGTVYPHMVRHVDMYPTMAELLGVQGETQGAPVQGVSLWPHLMQNTATPERFAFAQRRHKHPEEQYTQGWEEDEVYSLFDLKQKYIFHDHGDNELYDLAADPFELTNTLSTNVAAEGPMAERAAKLVDQMRADSTAIGRTKSEGVDVEALEAVGYL